MSDLHALTDLSVQLKRVNKKFAASIRKNLRAAIATQGAGVVSAVQQNASWSSRIPNAVKISTRFSTNGASVKISVDHNQAPHARPIDRGNANSYSDAAVNALGGYATVNGRRIAVNHSAYAAIRKTGIGLSRVLRHPVFHKTTSPGGYAEMATRPFFETGIQQSKAGIEEALENVVIQTAHDAGFKE